MRRLDARQALVEPLVAIREPAMVEPEKLKHGRVEVADVHGVLDDVVGEFVGLAVDRAGPGTTAGHPHGEAARVMVAAVVGVREAALRVNGPAEFAAPDDQGFVEEPACFQVADQARSTAGRRRGTGWAAGRRR